MGKYRACLNRHGTFVSVIAVALALRLAWVICVPVSPVSDSAAYDLLARNLARGIGYSWYPGNPTANWPVGTSFVYSVFYRLFGFSYITIIVFNIFISLITIWLSMLLTRRWFGRNAATLAGYLLAFWPVQIEFTSVLGSELIFNVLVVSWLAMQELSRWNRWAKVTIVGVLASATCYIRPVALLLPFVLCISEVIRSRNLAKPLTSMAIIYVIMAVLIAPWSIRNTQTFGHFFLLSTNGESNLWEGNNPTGTGETQDFPPEVKHMREGQREAYLGKIAKTYIKKYPGLFIARTIKKAFLLHDRESIGVYWNRTSLLRIYGARAFSVLKIFSDMYWWLMLFLGLLGAYVVVVRQGILLGMASLPILLWSYYTAVYSITVVQDRYHFAAIPFIAILSAIALHILLRRLASGESLRSIGMDVLQPARKNFSEASK